MKLKHLLIASTLVTAAATMPTFGELRSDKSEITKSLDIFSSLFKEVQLNYVDSLDAKKAINTAITYMLDEIDPYTEYYPSEDTEELALMATGEYGGVGSTINKGSDGRIRFSEPYAATPSKKAGVIGGDVILKIDSVNVTPTHTVQQVSDMLRGTPGTKLTVELLRPYAADSLLTIEIVREKIKTPSVPFYGLTGPDKNIGYITVNTFTDKAPAEVKSALTDLLERGATSLVLDLQGNPGGLLESAVDIVGLFVAKGTEVVRTRGRDASGERIYKTEHKPIAPKLPLAVLIDGNSASSSEIVAGALQDLDRAVIVGNRSYGKGLVQSSRQLPYDAMVKITVAKYYIPSGRLIQAIDYSRRNEDGSVARTPDSLTNVYKTLHGRQVRDGGGITPDVKADPMKSNRLLYAIQSGGFDIDYATKFAAENKTIVPADEFQISDSIFADFVEFIAPKDLKYENAYPKALEALRKIIEDEGYLNDSVQSNLQALETSLKPDIRRDLANSREQISYVLTDVIVSRYFDRAGAIEASLRFNRPLEKAIEILQDRREYDKLLSK
ncbi:MAG: S41 family peptidase [Muribaculaceae bacterium]|nr:S41 family peptidase [Muribaculaceae bacterium]